MSNDTTAEIEGKVFLCLKHLEIDAAHVVKMASHISGLVCETEKNRKQLIAEARGILEGRDAVDPLGGAHFVSGEYNRLREILDELEKLP